jgi:hypothetical protein
VVARPLAPLRAELQLVSDMRSHMSMHRKLLMHKQDQQGQFAGGPASLALGPSFDPADRQRSVSFGSKSGVIIDDVESCHRNDWWDEDPFDDSLFAFMADEPLENSSDGFAPATI